MVVAGLITGVRALVAGILIAVLGTLFIGAGTWLWSERTSALESGERSAQALARLLEEQTTRSIEAIDLTLMGIIDALTLNPDLKEHDPAFEDNLRRRLVRLPYVRALFIVDAQGSIAQDTNYPATPPLNVSDRSYFQAHAADPDLSLRIGEPLISRFQGTWFVGLSRRIDKPDGSFGGVAVASIDPTYIETFYRELELGADDSINLFRRDGTLLVRIPEPEGVIGRDFSSLQLFRRHLPASQTGVYRASSMIDGSPRMVGYRALEDYPLVATVTLGESHILAGWKRTLVPMIVAIGLIGSLAILLAGLWVRRLAEREEALRHQIQAQKLEALGQMTGTVAHDFNNLMGVVSGGLTLARRKVRDADVIELLDLAANAVQRGTKMTQQMLAFARRQKLEVVEADVNEMLMNLKDLLCQAVGPGVEIAFELADDVPHCRTDRTQFDTAILNLVINARDAMPAGGVIRISTSRCRAADRPVTAGLKAGPYACVAVADAGQGMDPDVQRRALEPFFTTKGDKGTGLGLSQVYGFVRQNGGDVRVESVPGKGTSIHLLFPGLEQRSSVR